VRGKQRVGGGGGSGHDVGEAKLHGRQIVGKKGRWQEECGR
jgi:hypothetical protein